MQISMFEAFVKRLKSASHAFSKGVLGEDAEDELEEEAVVDELEELAGEALEEPAGCAKSSGVSSAKDSPEEDVEAVLSATVEEALS